MGIISCQKLLSQSHRSICVAFRYKLVLLSFISIFFAGSLQAQYMKGISPYDTSLMSIHSPAKASFYSAILPGLGQAYNKKYWKIPLLYAGMGTLVYFINFHNTKYNGFKTAYVLRIANDPAYPDDFKKKGLEALYPPETLISNMDQFHRWRDLCVLGLAGVYLANIIDATVDAYLFDYDVSQDLSLHLQPFISPTLTSTNLGLCCTFRFK